MVAQPMNAFLRVKNLSTTFNTEGKGLHVLKQINFEVKESEFITILGPSGSGKSTLLRTIAGLLMYTTGEIYLAGKHLNGPRSGVGMIFQNANLMPWRTVLENIRLPMDLNQSQGPNMEKVHHLIRLVGLEGFENVLPRDLSGGMAQRVAIARALVQNPDLLLLDEPFGALDALTRERMGDELLRIWNAEQKTIIMVTHNIDEAIYLSDRIIILSDRPAHIVLDVPVQLPRPRTEETRYTPAFGALSKELRAALR